MYPYFYRLRAADEHTFTSAPVALLIPPPARRRSPQLLGSISRSPILQPPTSDTLYPAEHNKSHIAV